MAHRFAVTVDWDVYGRPVGTVPSLDDCEATGSDMEEMLDRLEEEVRSRLGGLGEPKDSDIELVGHDIWAI